MDRSEFIEFLNSIQIEKKVLGDKCYMYREYGYKKFYTTYQIVNLYDSNVSIHLSILDGKITESKYHFKLSDPDLKERVIEKILSFYDSYGIISNNMRPFIRDRNIGEILD